MSQPCSSRSNPSVRNRKRKHEELEKVRVAFDCVRCMGVLLYTVEDMIQHFREEHGICPETFTPERRRLFYDYFKLEENQYTEKEDTHAEEYQCTHREGDTQEGGCSIRTQTSKEKVSHFRVDESILNSEIVADQVVAKSVADSVQPHLSPKKQEKMNENPRQSIEEQGAGPYYCPDCGKGMGFELIFLKGHMTLHKGSCAKLPRKKLHTCEHCHIQYTAPLSLKQHTQKFKGKCGQSRKKRLTKTMEHLAKTTNDVATPEADPVQPCSHEKQKKLNENPRQSIEEQGAGPYYCPDCGKGMGYDSRILKVHMTLSKGSCAKLPRKKLHACEHCHVEYSSPYVLKYHTQKFRGRCARKKQ